MSLLPGDVDTPLMSAFAPFAPPEAVASRESEVNIFERMRRESDIETSAANASSDDGLLPPHPRLLREKTADRVRTVPVDLLRVATGGYQAKRVERHATVEALIKEVATLWDLNPDGLDLRYHGTYRAVSPCPARPFLSPCPASRFWDLARRDFKLTFFILLCVIVVVIVG